MEAGTEQVGRPRRRCRCSSADERAYLVKASIHVKDRGSTEAHWSASVAGAVQTRNAAHTFDLGQVVFRRRPRYRKSSEVPQCIEERLTTDGFANIVYVILVRPSRSVAGSQRRARIECRASMGHP